MAIYLGSNELDSLHLGSTDVENVYLGTNEVWENWDGILLQNGTFFENPYDITDTTGIHKSGAFGCNSTDYNGASVKTNGNYIKFKRYSSITFTYSCGNQTYFEIVDDNNNVLQTLYTLVNTSRAVSDSGTITINLNNVSGRLKLSNDTGAAQRSSSSASITYIKLNK